MHAIHPNARTTPTVRAEIARSRESYGFDIAPEWLRREMAAAGELRRADAA